MIGSQTFHFMKVVETQPVQLLSKPPKSHKLHLLGTISHKLNPKFELEKSKAEAIRQRSQHAEKERLARKTVELDSLSVTNSKEQKRLISRRKSNATSSTISSKNHHLNSVINTYSLKTRAIQTLAIGPITIDQLSQKLSTTPNLLTDIVKEICVDSQSQNILQLLPELYGQIKITDWPLYSMRERNIVCKNVSSFTSSTSSTTPVPISETTITPPETPETPTSSPKKQILSANFTSRSALSSAKKSVTAKDRLNAIMKKQRR